MRRALLPLAVAAFFSCGFLGFAENPAAVGNQRYAEGKYDEAINKYGEALIDEPDSPVLNFNMGDAHYRAGNYDDALASFGRAHDAESAERQARVAYNAANVQYRKAAQLEAEKPQEALKAYAETLVSYRRVLAMNSNDVDAKFNYELTVKRLKDLKERLEKEQQEQQDQEQQEQQEDQQQEQGEDQQQEQQDQQEQEQAQQNQGEEQEQQQDQQQEQQQGGEEKQEPPQEQQQAEEQQPSEEQQAQEAAAGEDEMSPGEAGALVDAARNDELRPEDFIRRQQAGALVQPAQDW